MVNLQFYVRVARKLVQAGMPAAYAAISVTKAYGLSMAIMERIYDGVAQ